MMWMLRARKSCCFSLALFIFSWIASAACGQQGSPDSNSDATFDQLSSQATSAREAGRMNDAIQLYQSALKLQPDWAEGWWYLGTLNYDADHYGEAIPPLQNLVALAPQMGPAWRSWDCLNLKRRTTRVLSHT